MHALLLPQWTSCGALHAQGNINLIDAAVAKGVKKFVLVTSIGTGNSKLAPPSQVYDVLKPVLLEKEKAEEHLKVLQSAAHRFACTLTYHAC
jgi:nucleoside-diphosphate-sugar epimerase